MSSKRPGENQYGRRAHFWCWKEMWLWWRLILPTCPCPCPSPRPSLCRPAPPGPAFLWCRLILPSRPPPPDLPLDLPPGGWGRGRGRGKSEGSAFITTTFLSNTKGARGGHTDFHQAPYYLHVSDGLSVHHQIFKTAHTSTGVCQTAAATCLLAFPLAAGSSSCLTYACWCMCSLEILMMDGKTARNM
jgi:hypothetical protein